LSEAKHDKVILGIDPGTTIMGYGVLVVKAGEMEMLTMGSIMLHKIPDHYQRLAKILDRVNWMIKEFKPTEIAIEAPFHGKNVQSMLKLGRAQGVAIAAALSQDLPAFEYAPKKIKMAITGNGNASKEQVAGMLQGILSLKNLPKHLDATDGLAAAVCHYFQLNSIVPTGSSQSWKDFVSKNPDRITGG
jgi:crossover junction endodeoxyribonuclease RuvC